MAARRTFADDARVGTEAPVVLRIPDIRGLHSRVHGALLALATALALLVSGPVVAPARADATGEVPVGARLREATLDGLNGPVRKLSAFRGRPLIVNVWASWCGPCRAETASLERLAWREDAARYAIIGISTDDYRDRAQAWLRASNATISHYIDHRLELENMLGANRLPLTVFVDADGRVLARVYGAKEWDGPEARQFIERTFRKK
jgi:thiol-disulfide isomerase/thioredoxin